MLAKSFLAGEQDVNGVVSRAESTLGGSRRWLGPLAKRYVRAFAGRTRPRRRDVVEFLLEDRAFPQVQASHPRGLTVKQWLTAPQRMHPVGAAKDWDIPAIESVGQLCQWLEVAPEDLTWFADLKGLGRKGGVSPLHHYYYRVLAKRSGDIRLIEAPKRRLKKIQRQILTAILDPIPPHPAAHGFLQGRSIRSFASPHVGKRVVLRMDLQDFFPCITAASIQAIFRTAGYPEPVADLLGGVCTNSVPSAVWRQPHLEVDPAQLWQLKDLYRRSHLPQGAPTSPALANLCAYRFDCRLLGLAHSAGADYTRYADDLAFSGDEEFDRQAARFSIHVASILLEEGFRANHRKTRIMRRGTRQSLAGLVTNQTLNIRRKDLDQLKATLTNCARLGPASQNHEAHPDFRAHLHGRIGFVESVNPARGAQLRRIFYEIQW
jgi:retron-type reverse transcriptase